MAKMEIWTGCERRRKWSDERKLQILEEVATSGFSVSEIARRHDVVPQQIYTWRRQLLGKAKAGAVEQEEPPVFLPVSIVAEPGEPEPAGKRQAPEEKKPRSAGRPGRIEIRCKCGRALQVDASIDPALLRALIRAVEDA